jgi:lysophospholipase
MISYHFLNQTTRSNFFDNSTAHGAGQLWSDIPKLPAYQNHQAPFPMVVADARPVGSNLTTALGLEATVYEVCGRNRLFLYQQQLIHSINFFCKITPLELASYDPSLSAGMNLTFVGTRLTEGRPDNGTACVVGLDQAGFVMGTSAALFNVSCQSSKNIFTQY